MTDRSPVSLSPGDIAAVRSWVIHEDAHLIAFDKPSGLSSQGGRIQAHTLDDLLWAFARSNGKRPDLVHRLDRDTSGVILAGKTKPATAFLGKALQAKRFRKTYLALVESPPDPRGGEIDPHLLRQEVGRESHMRVVEEGTPGAQPSRTRYRTLSANDHGSLIELEPLTGRMHQLRVHMAHIGRPLVGDVRYGGALTFSGGGGPRLVLHTAQMNFPPPTGGDPTGE
ncbi:MAG: RluA family pseudouridine synthase, partial [Brevundimonas sp.]|uniref:RluA family pseudouridine synthase n=1 Tax=Brevundimonas sp. TaxID=1871086 RepID=UPI00391D7959